jgi:hypothetical protein
MNKEQDINACAYCGARNSTSDDHIPPESLFADPKPSNLITVPSCERCHRGTYLDDEYFKTIITLRDEVGEHPDVKKILPSTIRGLKGVAKWKYYLYFKKRTHWVLKKSQSGIVLGLRPAYEVDFARVYKVINRISRGLYYHETKEILGASVEVRSHGLELWDKDDFAFFSKYMLAPLLKKQKRVIGNDVFSYVYHIVPDEPKMSVWLMEFYNKIDFFAMTMPIGYPLPK